MRARVGESYRVRVRVSIWAHKVPRLARSLHCEVQKVLQLPRNLICSSRFTKCCACHEICTLRGSQSAAPATNSSTSRFTKCCACHEICTSRSYKVAAPAEVHKTCTKSAIQGSQSAVPATKSALQGSQSATAPATKSENEPHVEVSRFTAPVRKSERLEDFHHAQSPKCCTAPAMKSALRSKAAPIPCTCHEKSTLEPPKHEVSLAPATKSDHHVRKCAQHHIESAVATSTRSQPTRFSEPAQSKCTLRISRGMHVL